MARREHIELVDDLDGSTAGETVSFGLDRQLFEIDLNRENAAKLRAALASYIDAGRATRGASRKPALGPDPRAVRAWAKANQISLPARGRLPSAVVDQFRAAGYH